MIFKRTIFFIALIILVQIGMSQVSTTVRASVSTNKVLLGEPFVLTIKASIPSATAINFVQIDTIPHFEFLEKPKLDSTTTDGGIIITGIYKIASFDSGHWVIPSFTLTKGVWTDTIPIDVVFSDFNPDQEYHDIKDIIEVKTKKEGVLWWAYAIAAALMVLTVIFFSRRKKKPVVAVNEKIIANPYEEAMQQLAALQKENTDAKTYYAELVNIFRLYIFRKKGILSLQKTTDDLILQIKDVVSDKEQFDKLSQTLRLSDFVKFAKYIPVDDDKRTSYSDILNSIKLIEGSGA